MRRFYFPTKDASIYQELPDRQTGMDEILEIGKTGDGIYSARSLIQFDMAFVSSSLMNGTLPINCEFSLKMFVANVSSSQLNQSIEVYPLSQSWMEGQGYFYQNSFEDPIGVTWRNRTTGSSWVTSGSDFISTIATSQSLALPIADLEISMSNLIRNVVSSSIPDYGFLLKFPSSDESGSSNMGRAMFFSKDTHTIFSPVLIAKWDDSIYSTGSMTASVNSGLIVYPTNLRPSYTVGEKIRVDLTAREQYPTKQFTNIFSEWSSNYLPTSSYYSITDVQSQEVIIPFDNSSKISVDSYGNYFQMYIEKMFPKRYYKLKIKVQNASGYSYVFDNNYTFTVNV